MKRPQVKLQLSNVRARPAPRAHLLPQADIDVALPHDAGICEPVLQPNDVKAFEDAAQPLQQVPPCVKDHAESGDVQNAAHLALDFVRSPPALCLLHHAQLLLNARIEVFPTGQQTATAWQPKPGWVLMRNRLGIVQRPLCPLRPWSQHLLQLPLRACRVLHEVRQGPRVLRDPVLPEAARDALVGWHQAASEAVLALHRAELLELSRRL
mmetsp:Transcript_47513/g.144311  ORF Transcript_47513/g.144311 Transcript_47513/m.144311 type:complete len:210 (+) Transcript_47513:611-1240(+)